MGGKHKQAQRTKNNARPSSSGRSAELLGSSVPQFVGFSNVKDSGLVLPSFSLLPDDVDLSIDTNFQMVLKKMNKKDSTTKLKALQEFTELIKTTETEPIKSILPFWPRLYNTLATDTEHRVREAAHIAHNQLVLKAKRNIALILKQVIGPWFTAQYDIYAPAATAATLAFQNAFPSNKIQEAIVFCQEEILSYIYDNILVQTAQTLSNPNVTSAEDAEAKYQRVVISSLQGYTLYLNKVPFEQIQKASELNMKIMSNNKFWKLAKNKVAPIRAAWFGVLTALCQNTPLLLEKEGSHVTGSTFGNLDENEPTVLPLVWEAALSTVTTIKEWWKLINVEKLVLPKLWKILREGGQGNAAVIFPNLLPFVSHLPPLADMNSFYDTFFDNMKTGMKQKTVISSRSEAFAVSQAFIECLQYIILKNQHDVVLCEKLIKTHLIPALEWSFLDSNAVYKTLFNQVAPLIQYWHRNRFNAECCNYQRYFNYFWSNITSLFQGLLLNVEQRFERNLLSDVASKQIEFLLSMKRIIKPKKQLKVSFSLEKSDDKRDNIDGNTLLDPTYIDALNKFAYIVCENYVKLIIEKQSKELLEHLLSLVQEFDSESFFQHLRLNVGTNSNILDIYTKLFLPWLQSDWLCSDAVVGLIFLLFKYLNTEEQLNVLKTFNQLSNEKSLGWCIAKTLSHPYNNYDIIQNWLKNDEITEFFVKIAEQELADDSSPELSLLLKQVFTENDSGELYISKNAVALIIQVLNRSLLSPSDYPVVIDTCASFAAYISSTLYAENLRLTYGDELLLAMFKLSCNNEVDTETLSKDTLWEVTTAWQDAIANLAKDLPHDDFNSLTEKCALVIEQTVLDAKDINIEKIVDVIVNYIRSTAQGNTYRVHDVVKLLTNRNFATSWQNTITDVCVFVEFLQGKLSCPYESLNLSKMYIEEVNVLKYFQWINIMVSVVAAPTALPNQDEDESDDENTVSPILSIIDDNLEFVLDLLYSLELANCLIENIPALKYFIKITQKSKTIKKNLQILIYNMNSTHKEQLEAILTLRMVNGWLWMRTGKLLLTDILLKQPCSVYEQLIKKQELRDSQLCRLHLTQVFAKSLSYDHINEKLSTVESIILLNCLLHCVEIDVQIAEIFAKIEKMKQDDLKHFLFASENSDTVTWSQAQTVVEVIRFFSSLLKYNATTISSNRWDLIIISLSSWCSNATKLKTKYCCPQIASFILATSDLFSSVIAHVQAIEKENPNSSIISEWKDLFAQKIHKDILEIWLYLCDQYQHQKDISTSSIPFMQEFGKVLNNLDYIYLFDRKHSNLPKWSKILQQSCTLLLNPVHLLQLWGYRMLKILIPGLINVDSVSVDTNTPHEKGLIFEQFKEALIKTQDIVQLMLLEFKLGEDSCKVEPFTDSYTYTFAYFLLWDVLLMLCEQSSTELRYQYADWLRNEDFLNNLLNNIFKLIPTEILQYTDTKTKPLAHLFLTKFSSNISGCCSSEKIEHMVCWIYMSTLSQLPALVRQWWTGSEARTAQIVENITAAYVSPHLCKEELADVAQHETKFKNMVVKVHPSIREVVAIYTVDEAQMELVITLPTNYPLGGPDVQCNRQICGTSHRQWLMQLKMGVLHQNGKIWDGLSLWNNNLDKKFDGVEECYICFAVLHQGTYQLPKLSCQTCRKKFHSACLYKWFSTSNKSTCPICRNLF